MRSRLRIALLTPLATLLACGGSSNSSIGVASTAASGDYIITVASGTAKASTFTGAITATGNSYTGVFQYNNPGTLCVSNTQDIPFTGTVTNGTLTLTSSTFSSSVATITIPLPLSTFSGGQQLSNGTAVITGGTCVLASTTSQTLYVPSLAGTYNGTLTGPVTGTASAVITESTANSDGQFPATIAISFTSISNSSCNFSIPGSSPASTVISGATLQASQGNISVSVNALLPPSSFSVMYNPTGPGTSGCSGSYSGTLTD